MFNTKQILKDTLTHNGTTVNIEGKNKDYGYYVSLRGYEVRIPMSDTMTKGKIALDEFINANIEVLAQDRHYLGTWIHGDFMYIDISYWTVRGKLANSLGIENGQLAYYDVRGKKVVSTLFRYEDEWTYKPIHGTYGLIGNLEHKYLEVMINVYNAVYYVNGSDSGRIPNGEGLTETISQIQSIPR